MKTPACRGNQAFDAFMTRSSDTSSGGQTSSREDIIPHPADEEHPLRRRGWQAGKAASDLTVCCAKLQVFLAQREYAEQEMRVRLCGCGFDVSVVDEAIARACQTGIIDDARFADLFITQKINAGWGQLKIERELQRRGVSGDILPGYPEPYFSFEQEVKRARICADGYQGRAKDKRNAIFNRLMSKGFSSEVCSVVLRGYYRETT